VTVRADPSAPDRSSPRRRAGRGLLKRFSKNDDRRIRRRRKELDERLLAIEKASRGPDLPSDSLAFLLLALGRLNDLLESLPHEVRGQELTLSWVEGLLGPLEHQAAVPPPELAPFATRLPTTVAEEQRRRQAMSLLQAAGSRLRREREEIMASLDEVEADLS